MTVNSATARLSRTALYVFAALAVVLATYLTVQAPEWALVAALATVGMGIATTAIGRGLIFVSGIMLLFQSATVPQSVRALFLAAVAVLALPSLLSIARKTTQLDLNLRRFVAPGILMAGVIVLGSITLFFSPRPVDDWLRDSTTYVLILLAPIYGLDLALGARRRSIEVLTLVVGFLGAFSFLVTWLNRRGFGILGLEQFALASSLAAIPSIALCLVYFYGSGQRRWLWGLAGLVQAGMLVGTGGRSGVIYISAALAVFFLFGGMIGKWLSRTVALVGVGAVAAIGLIAAGSALGILEFLTGRYDWFADASLQAVAADGSGQDRLFAFGVMGQYFSEAPLIGNGLGTTYPSVVTGQVTAGTYGLDTPLTAFAKFGIVGAVLLALSLILLVRASGTVGTTGTQPSRERWMFLAANAVVWAAMLPGGLPTEQKGFAISACLIVALCAAWGLEGKRAPKLLAGRGAETTLTR